MSRILAAAFLLVHCLAISGGVLLAQTHRLPPSPQGQDTQKLSSVPSASKSVEVGDFYLRRKKYNAALSRYEEAAATDPYYARAYLGLGRVYDRIGLKHKALDAYHKYPDLLPSAKDAEDAKAVHQAMARIKHNLNKH